MSDFAKNKECFRCGEKGHLKAQRPKLKGRRSSTPLPVCELCGQMGYLKNIFWEDPKNVHLRPGNWVSRLEKKTGEADVSCVKIIL